MAKKIKRKPTGTVYIDPELEEVGEERAFEIELDEETNEILMVHHYRRKWGDEMDSDVEHGLNVEEAGALVVVLLDLIQILTDKANASLVEKATPEPIEGNPMKDNPVQ
jgi:hypothetical protein